MSLDLKILLGIIVFSLILVIGAAYFLSSSAGQKATLEKVNGAKIEVLEESFNFGDIDYSAGVVNHEYLIKNIGDKPLEIANLATSCMCTKVFAKGPFGESEKVSMKGMSKPSSWKGELKSGEEGKIVAVFDPAFHGPGGIGPISRTVSFETNDSEKPYVELLFEGNVRK